MNTTRFIAIFLLLFFGSPSLAQEQTDEQLRNSYGNTSLADSIRVDAAIEMADRIFFSDIDSTQKLIEQAKIWSLRSDYHFGLARVDGYLGYIFHVNGEYVKAIEAYKTSINYNLKHGFDLERAMDLGNYGALLNELNDPKALDCFEQSISIYEKYDKRYDLVFLYSSVGDYFLQWENLDSALYYFTKGLQLAEDPYSKMIVQTGLALTHRGANHLDSAAFYSRAYFPTAVEYGDTSVIRTYYQSMMEIKYKQNDLDSALYFAKKANEIQSNYSHLLKDDYYFLLSRIYAQKGQYRNAFDMLDSAYTYVLATHDKDMQDMAFREAVNFEFNEKHLSDSLNYLKEKELKDIKHQNDLQVEAQQRYILYAVLGMLGLIFIVVYRGYRRKKTANEIIFAQKEEVELQKKLVEEKNKEIVDSIEYAKRIQSAVLPSPKIVHQLLPNSFILYLPKDIVAGDFYWIQPTENELLVAVADCTGHGVPGAMVSVICNTALNRSVREYGVTDPGEILDKTRSLVIAEFEKSDEEVYDGMDIALVALATRSSIEKENEKNTLSHSTSASLGVRLKYAGAHNPLWVVRKGECIEIQADKMPIGKFGFEKSFTTHQVELEKDDLLYIFSDGYADQFGGDKGKKFKPTAFKDLLLSIYHLPLQEQQTALLTNFQDWKGDLEQVDDVCVIGVRI